MDKCCDWDELQQTEKVVQVTPSARTHDTQLGATVDSFASPTSKTNDGFVTSSLDQLPAMETSDQGKEGTRFSSLTVMSETGVQKTKMGSVREALQSCNTFTESVVGLTSGTCSQQEQCLGKDDVDLDGKDVFSEECPICAELYAPRGEHRRALLNCDHVVCQKCVSYMLCRSADASRVSCPLCRQKTPLVDCEIRRMQEEAMCLMDSAGPGPPAPLALPRPPSPPAAGRCAALERRLNCHVETALVCGCFRHPRWLVRGVRRLRRPCRCCYFSGLLLLYLAELSCVLFVFLPVIVLVLLFTLTSKSR